VQQKSSANDTRSGYYCGPATAYMMLKFLGYSTSKHNSSHSLTQDRLASSTYLNTITVKATKWDSKVMETGIKAWTKDALRYRQINAPTVAVVKGKLINRIGRNGQPFAADTVEFTGGKHYNGHPNRTIGHWIAAKGYTNSGNTATWVDPAIPRFLNNDGLGKTSFSEPTSSFTADYLQSNGILG
ncbi:MAG: hypothetical protein GX610_16445, partial [Rhodococcus sp.]|nr:hypothetical protein [Rhodococcus sp. (in: high G+C Gram-positive bacteria)]